MPPVFSKVALGGTFHIIHKGHELLLKVAFQLGKQVVIGLTSDEMARKLRKHHKISGYADRERRLRNHLKRSGLERRCIIVPLKDRYGPTVHDKDIDCIVISKETLKVAEKINRIRIKKGLRPLIIVCIGTVLAEDMKPISTTRIIKGEIDRKGKLVKST